MSPSDIPNSGHTATDGELDPEIAETLRKMEPWSLADIPAVRRRRADLAEQAHRGWRPPRGVLVEDGWVPRELDTDPVEGGSSQEVVPVRTYRPDTAGAPKPLLIWMHGGGHVFGQASQDDDLLARLVARTGCMAASVDWRHSPEHPYPAALDDCRAVLRWAAADESAIDATRIVVGGMSAGGGLAAGLSLHARDHGGPMPAAQVLLAPMLDDRTGLEEVRRRGPLPLGQRVWSPENNVKAWTSYLGAEPPRTDVPVYAAPARADDLSGLPPAWVAVGSQDLFAAEDIEFAHRLKGAGVPVELRVFPDACHGFEVIAPGAAVSRRFLAERDRVLDKLLCSS